VSDRFRFLHGRFAVGLAVEPGKQSCSFIGRESLVRQFCAGVLVYAHGGTEAVGFVGKKVWLMLA